MATSSPDGPQLYMCGQGVVGPYNSYVIANVTESPMNASTVGGGDVTPGTDRLASQSQSVDAILAGPILATICIFGIFGNAINLLVLSRKAMLKGMARMEKSAHLGLIALALADMCFCVTALPSCFIRKAFLTASHFQALYQIYHEGMINIFLLASTWLTVTMAVSRYVAICHPLRARMLIGMSFVKGAVILVFVFSVVFNVPRFLESAPASVTCYEGGYMYYWVPGPLSPMIRPDFKFTYQWLYFTLGILLPFLVMLFCNIRLILALRESRQMAAAGSKHNRSGSKNSSQTRRVTLTLVIIVVMYLVLVSPAELNTFLRDMALSDVAHLAGYNIAVSVLNVLQSINFAFNFVLYCAVNTYFRRTMREFLCRRRGGIGSGASSSVSFRSMVHTNKGQNSTPQFQTYVSEMSTAI